jgi:hypothetical protein
VCFQTQCRNFQTQAYEKVSSPCCTNSIQVIQSEQQQFPAGDTGQSVLHNDEFNNSGARCTNFADPDEGEKAPHTGSRKEGRESD